MKPKKQTYAQKLRAENKELKAQLAAFVADRKKVVENAVEPDPIQSIMDVLRSKANMTQNAILQEITERVASERIKNMEMADAQARVAKSYFDDFVARHPHVVNYKPQIS